MIKRKEPIKIAPQKRVSLDTPILGKEIEFELETSPRICSPFVTMEGEGQILKEGDRDRDLNDQKLTLDE